MESRLYKTLISKMVRNGVRKNFPGLKLNGQALDAAAVEIARAIHARFYGMAVDDVASPIWRDHDKYREDFSDAKPTKTAQELLDND